MTDEGVLAAIAAAFPEAVVSGPEGDKDPALVVDSDALVEVAAYIGEQVDSVYLSSITAVDHEDRLEVIYHFYSMAGGTGPLVLKVYLSNKETPEVPSLTSLWSGAEFQEREVYDFFGIRFTGHPDLRRIFTWEGFPGHPLRKDFEAEWPLTVGELVAEKYGTPGCP